MRNEKREIGSEKREARNEKRETKKEKRETKNEKRKTGNGEMGNDVLRNYYCLKLSFYSIQLKGFLVKT